MSRRAAIHAPAPSAPAAPFTLQRKCPCGGKPRGHEEDEARGAAIQSKLTVGRPDDPYEREADAVAERASRPRGDAGGPPRITPLVQRKSAAKDSPRLNGVESELRRRRGQGSPLPDATRTSMEERFGVDFSRVRIHADAAAHGLTARLDSLAFTQGSDIYFSGGRYRPGTEEGDRLLAHELTHVVQQGGGAAGGVPHVQREGGEGSAAEEPAQETKAYYMTAPRHSLLGARGPLSGSGVHEGMENRLRKFNPALVTEAPIPGATESDFFEETADRWRHFTKVGRADLNMSSTPNGISGIRGRLSRETLEGDHTRAVYQYRGRRNLSAEAGS